MRAKTIILLPVFSFVISIDHTDLCSAFILVIFKRTVHKGMHLIDVFAFFSQVANPMVRANAAALLTDTFPLQNPDAANEEIDALLQKQFDIMKVPVY